MDCAENTIPYCCSSVVAAIVAQQRVYMPQITRWMEQIRKGVRSEINTKFLAGKLRRINLL
jgi:hypothetical protein